MVQQSQRLKGNLSVSWRTLQTCFLQCPSASEASWWSSAWRPSSFPPVRETRWARCGSSPPPRPRRRGSPCSGPATGPPHSAPSACGAGPFCCPRSRWAPCLHRESLWRTWCSGRACWRRWNWLCRRCCRPERSHLPIGPSYGRETSPPKGPVKSDIFSSCSVLRWRKVPCLCEYFLQTRTANDRHEFTVQLVTSNGQIQLAQHSQITLFYLFCWLRTCR